MEPIVFKRFDAPDELRSFEKGTFALVDLGGLTIGHDVWAAHSAQSKEPALWA